MVLLLFYLLFSSFITVQHVTKVCGLWVLQPAGFELLLWPSVGGRASHYFVESISLSIQGVAFSNFNAYADLIGVPFDSQGAQYFTVQHVTKVYGLWLLQPAGFGLLLWPTAGGHLIILSRAYLCQHRVQLFQTLLPMLIRCAF